MTDTPPPIPPEAPPASTMRRDIISAYAASAARVLGLATISAILLRKTHFNYFAAFMVARSALVVCNYLFAGLAPAVQRSLAISIAARPTSPNSRTLAYATPQQSMSDVIYGNALTLAAIAAFLCLGLLFVYADHFTAVHGNIITRHWWLSEFVFCLGIGQILRSFSDVSGAALQVRGHIALDNMLVVLGECLWVSGSAFSAFSALSGNPLNVFLNVATFYALSGGALLIARLAMNRVLGMRQWFAELPPDWRIIGELLGFGALVVLSQIAEFLYAPFATLLVQSLMGARAVAAYAPAIQIDAGLLLGVSAIASVLLPKTALAHSAGNAALVRLYYVRGTLVSLVILLGASLLVWLLSPWIFRLWLGDPMPATQAILPLVLVHTVIGGSSAVGRSVLLGMGRVKPVTISVLVGGAVNVILSVVFVMHLNLGLKGVVLGTIIAVTGRCAIWMPWYINRSLRR